MMNLFLSTEDASSHIKGSWFSRRGEALADQEEQHPSNADEGAQYTLGSVVL